MDEQILHEPSSLFSKGLEALVFKLFHRSFQSWTQPVPEILKAGQINTGVHEASRSTRVYPELWPATDPLKSQPYGIMRAEKRRRSRTA